MGIKGLNPFLKKKCVNAFTNLPYSYFTGKRVAWDCDNIFRKLMARAHKEIINKTDLCTMEANRDDIVELWFKYCKQDILKWLQFGITIIFVFDGKYIEEKSETQNKRRAEKQKRISEAERLKCEVFSKDELERTIEDLKNLRKTQQYLSTIKLEEKERLIGILKASGFPVLKATEEGEKLCAMLCIEGKVDAVYSRDTDLVAMGCPLTITDEAGFALNKENGKMEQIVKCTLFKPILPTLNMNYETFLDLCIMSGCDFNDNIYKCGIGTSYKLLSECKKIEDLPEKYKDRINVLNHVKCREIFKNQKSLDICQHEIQLNINKDLSNSRELLEMYNFSDWIEDLVRLYKILPDPPSIYIEKRPCIKNSRLILNILDEKSVDNKIIDNKSPKFPEMGAPSPEADKSITNQNLLNSQLERYGNLKIQIDIDL